MADDKGKKYDKNFVSTMVDKHKEAIEMFNKCANDCTDADIKSWFASTVPALQTHLDSAMVLKDKIDKMK